MAKQIFHKIKSNFASIVTNRGFNRSHRPKDGSIRKTSDRLLTVINKIITQLHLVLFSIFYT